ncbi:hypothetical protein SMSP2_01780 [Limihaloglobus sulfuriphilus]|uniref:HTH HARE-type domain-containing protein n=1 Tax=Limihaloglobus sulfuriphilus TaxID=1851148 RepID=A0A1Q2MFD6_9BACT|nr:winged helix-turn-helix domain-containing protein [Limihaloglobus sulfuriphilus]AQQ71406.1 hypothetical protein SMSP2_01780 [Limihaloglobus sulfuriphilus]
MKKSEIKINGLYLAKVTNRTVAVKITGKHAKEGWEALNTATGKKVHIKTPERLEGPAEPEKNTEPKAKAEKPKKAPQPKAGKKAKAKPSPKDKQKAPKKASLFEVALIILKDSDMAMSCAAIVEQAMEKDLWKPAKGGKTPANTLYATFLREIKNKGKDALVVKTLPGRFALKK